MLQIPRHFLHKTAAARQTTTVAPVTTNKTTITGKKSYDDSHIDVASLPCSPGGYPPAPFDEMAGYPDWPGWRSKKWLSEDGIEGSWQVKQRFMTRRLPDSLGGGFFPPRKFPRHPDPTRLYVIPEEFFRLMYPHTGVTGPYLIMFGTTFYMLGKEILNITPEFAHVITGVLFPFIVIKTFGKKVQAYWMKGTTDYLAPLEKIKEEKADEFREENVLIEEEIQRIVNLDKVKEAYLDVVEDASAVEAREREHAVAKAFQDRLEHALAVETSDKRIRQQQMVAWVKESVIKSLSPEQEKEFIQQCIKDLKEIAGQQKSVA